MSKKDNEKEEAEEMALEPYSPLNINQVLDKGNAVKPLFQAESPDQVRSFYILSGTSRKREALYLEVISNKKPDKNESKNISRVKLIPSLESDLFVIADSFGAPIFQPITWPGWMSIRRSTPIRWCDPYPGDKEDEMIFKKAFIILHSGDLGQWLVYNYIPNTTVVYSYMFNSKSSTKVFLGFAYEEHAIREAQRYAKSYDLESWPDDFPFEPEGVEKDEDKMVVECIASGYEWICEHCNHINKIIEFPKADLVICEFCNSNLLIAPDPHHANE